MNLNDEFLKHFMATFYGSGNYSGDYWFVGMEEGGGNDLAQVTARLNAWKELGGTELVDIYDFHMKIGFPQYFEKEVVLQPTWKQQARIVLSAQALASEKEDVSEYQRDVIGRKNSETCLLELLPLPSPSTNVWNYDKWTSLEFLRNRKTYRDYSIPWRVNHLHSRIKYYRPKAVVFLGFSYLEYWQAVAGESVRFFDQGGYWAGQAEGTKYIISKHPAAHGITNAYFDKIGLHIYQSK